MGDQSATKMHRFGDSMLKFISVWLWLGLVCVPTQAAFFPALPKHEFVVGPALSSSPQALPTKPANLPQATSMPDVLTVADAMVFFQQALFLTYHMTTDSGLSQQTIVAQCFHPQAWQTLQQSGYAIWHQGVVNAHAQTSMVPLLPPQFKVLSAPSQPLRLSIDMPIMVQVKATGLAQLPQRFAVQAQVRWVGLGHGLRGWQIYQMHVAPMHNVRS